MSYGVGYFCTVSKVAIPLHDNALRYGSFVFGACMSCVLSHRSKGREEETRAFNVIDDLTPNTLRQHIVLKPRFVILAPEILGRTIKI